MRTLATLSSLVLAVSLFAACSSTSDSTTTTAQGPISGTYSADSLDGTAPFVTITFLDASHYQYVSKTCVPQDPSEPGDDDAGAGTTTTGGDDDGSGDDAGSTTTTTANGDAGIPDLGDDPGSQVVDNGATEDFNADPTDNGCIHTGTYKVTQTDLTLTDDSSAKTTDIPITQLDPDGSEVTDPTVTSIVTTQDSLTVGTGGTKTDALTSGSTPLLFGQTSVSQFNAAGTHMRRTGLTSGAGTGSACAISDGTTGSCQTTSSCSSSGKVSTPDFCPGAANIQCCTSSTSGNSSGGTSNMVDGLVTSTSVGAAEQWVSVKMPYCQAVQGGRELDPSCFRVHGHTCNRTGSANNVTWNRYRSDCSGLVSYAWTLAAPGLTTSGFVPSAAKYIPMQDLQAGDALIRPGHHIVLFKAWTNKSAGQAAVISEPGCDAKGGPHAQNENWSMGRAPGAGTSAHWAGATYYSIRKKGSTLTQ